MYARLVEEEDFEGSYSSVQRYVKRWREEHRSDGDGYLELDWSAGVMQVDFGEAVATIGGGDVKVHCLVATFPHSNMRYVVAMPGENAECVCEGLAQIFDHIGMAPRVLVLDNATGAGHRVAWNKVTVVRVFAMFCDHYRLETRFRDPVFRQRGGLRAPVPGRDQRVRATERDLHHEHRVQWLGTRVRRPEHGHRDSGQDDASRQDDQVRGRVVQAHPRPDGIETKQ